MKKKIQDYLQKLNPLGAFVAFFLGFMISGFATQVFIALGN